MSSTVLKFIPSEPDFIPSKTDQNNAHTYLNKILGSDKIEFIQTPDIEFIDQGANFDSLICNYCNHIIDIQLWQDAMEEAGRNKFTELSFITSCCHKKTSLNDLSYHGPAGFAKFVIVISDPKTDIKENELAELEHLLNTKIRKIWAHY